MDEQVRAAASGIARVSGESGRSGGGKRAARDAAAGSLQRATADRCDHGCDHGGRYSQPHFLDVLYRKVIGRLRRYSRLNHRVKALRAWPPRQLWCSARCPAGTCSPRNYCAAAGSTVRGFSQTVAIMFGMESLSRTVWAPWDADPWLTMTQSGGKVN